MPSEKLSTTSGQSSSNDRLSDAEKNRLAATMPKLLRAAGDDAEPIDVRRDAESDEPSEDELTPEAISQAMIVAAQLGDTEGLGALRKLAETMTEKGT